HALALFYVVAALGVMVRIAETPRKTPVRLVGRQGLAVFATGTVLSLFLQAVKTGVEGGLLLDSLLLGTGLLVLVGLAYVLTRTQEMTRAASRPAGRHNSHISESNHN
ncbi:MAG: OpgC domain-containing protein, partial [Devosia sp.]|nr:OpgC domain-containing protein [Devosia sp.]